jgi:flavin reductase (DIM6/NTAB) family NADH-FMN oxidoreductase RutF
LTVTPDAFRRTLGRFASGVTIVTGRMPTGEAAGLTVSAFSSLSLDPPLVLVCIDRGTRCLPAFIEGSHFAVNILAEDQRHLAERFARTVGNRFDGIEVLSGETGCPLFPKCVAWLECQRSEVVEGGDHFIITGRPLHVECQSSPRPLLHFSGTYRRLDPPPQSPPIGG